MAYNKQKRDRATRRLASAIRKTERVHPLPRCEHGKPLRDGAGEPLEPPCGCRLWVEKMDCDFCGATGKIDADPLLNPSCVCR